jgi:hypothetical protein
MPGCGGAAPNGDFGSRSQSTPVAVINEAGKFRFLRQWTAFLGGGRLQRALTIADVSHSLRTALVSRFRFRSNETVTICF